MIIKVEPSALFKPDARDIAAYELFESNKEKYDLDRGNSIDDRYRAASRMTRELFVGTPYFVDVEEYCVGCTVSGLYKDLSF